MAARDRTENRLALMAWLAAVSEAAGCGPSLPGSDATAGDAASSSDTADAASGPPWSRPNDSETSPPATTGSGGTGGDRDGTIDGDGDGDEGGFIHVPDGGGPLDPCGHPMHVEQAATCENGVLDPGELCYQGVATLCAAGGPEGVWLGDFGHGMKMVYAALEPGVLHLHGASVEGFAHAPMVVETPSWPYGVVVHDADVDGTLDLVVAEGYGDGDIAVLRGLGDGTFSPWTTSPGPAAHLRLADLDGDGIRDIVGTTGFGYSLGDVRMMFGAPGGTFGGATDLSLDGDAWPAIADFNGDGRDDLAVTHWHAFPEGEILAWLSPFDVGQAQIIDESVSLGRVIAGRFDDGPVPDVAYTKDTSLVLRFGLGDGTFGPPQTVESYFAPVDAADLDGDGRDELIGSSAVTSFAPDGMPGEPVVFDPGYAHYGVASVATAEVNDDGLLDLVFATGYGQINGTIHLVLSTP